MKTVELHKASPLRGDDVEPLQIKITEEVPDNFVTQEGMERFYNNEAKMLCDAILDTLPQATINRIIIRLMQGYAGYYRGIYGKGSQQ